jgi:hypothetical protein
MPAELRSFDAPIEPVVYLDSTYTIAYFDNTNPFHAECDAFGRRCCIHPRALKSCVYKRLIYPQFYLSPLFLKHACR